MRQHRLQRPPLHPVVARPRRMRRQGVLGTLEVLKQIGRIAAPVHRRTAELGQPDRLHPRNPGRRRRRPHARDPLMVSVRPPPLQVLGSIQPVLAMRPVADRRPHLSRPILGAGVIPVEVLAARDLHRQIGRVRRPLERLRIQPAVARAPVAQRRIPVDADVIDVGIGPQRVQMEPRLAVLLPAEILRPVRRIGQLHPRPDHRPTLRRQRPELRRRRKAAAGVARPRQPPHLRADQQAVRTFFRRHPRIVQRQPPQAPAARRPEQGRDLRRRACAVRPGHAPAPRIARAVHEDEGIQRHLHPPRLQAADRLAHALVRRRPAIGRPAVDL
ncbi:hypothetical protein D3C72_775710 [compost metagenome]